MVTEPRLSPGTSEVPVSIIASKRHTQSFTCHQR